MIHVSRGPDLSDEEVTRLSVFDPKTSDYCAVCGHSPNSGDHVFDHAYVAKPAGRLSVIEHWVEDPDMTNSEHVRSFKSPDGLSKAFVKWDGCANVIYTTGNPNEDPDCYEHHCSLNLEIARLTELRDKARAFFGEEWDE